MHNRVCTRVSDAVYKVPKQLAYGPAIIYGHSGRVCYVTNRLNKYLFPRSQEPAHKI